MFMATRLNKALVGRLSWKQRKANLISTTIQISAHARNGRLDDARRLFDRMPLRDAVAFNVMITAYAQNGHLELANALFQKIPIRNIIAWTSIITAHAHNGHPQKALELFNSMESNGVRPNKVTYVSALDACTQMEDLRQGRIAHGGIVDICFYSDIIVETALIGMYAKCGCFKEARGVFDAMPTQDAISWNTMLAVYARSRQLEEARSIFDLMPFRDVTSWNAMISAYAQSELINDARSMFDRMPERNVVSWNAIIAASAQNGHSKEACGLFHAMEAEGVRPDRVTFVSMLDACAKLGVVENGRTIHVRVVQIGYESCVVVGTALVTMYSKCGYLDYAKRVFEKMARRNFISWNAMITGYAQNGEGKRALSLLRGMALEGMKMYMGTFTNILAACSHAGLVDDGRQCFVTMYRNHGIVPTMEHYVCMIDLFGRAGLLDEAEDWMGNISFEPPFVNHVVAWRCLLSACRNHFDMERGTHSAEHLCEMNPDNGATLVVGCFG